MKHSEFTIKSGDVTQDWIAPKMLILGPKLNRNRAKTFWGNEISGPRDLSRLNIDFDPSRSTRNTQVAT